MRQEVQVRAMKLGFRAVDQTKLVTAASEIARNTLDHGQGGTVDMEFVERNGQFGISLTFEDRGPGIADIAEAMEDGFTTSTGFGLGLPGAKRLVHEFRIQSETGRGTKVVLVRWS